MSDHIVFQDCPIWAKDAIKSYWQQKASRIERLLAKFPEDQRELRLTVTYRPNRYDLHAVLLLPTGSLVAEVSAKTDREAIDAVTDKLTGELRRHKEIIRHENLYRRKQQRQELSERATAGFQPDAEPPDKEAFFNLLSPLMDRLRDHAQNELVVAELQGRMGREQMAVNDLLDEAILRAWSRLDRKDPAVPLEVWLTRLLHEVLDGQIDSVHTIHPLDEQIELDETGHETIGQPVADDTPVWEETLAVTLEDVLPSHEEGEPWEELAAVDQMKWIMSQLSRVSARQRRAFTLHVLDGWEPDEVALIQSREVDEVQRDIAAVRAMLQRRLAGESELRPADLRPAHRVQ